MIEAFLKTGFNTVLDVIPIVLVVLAFQFGLARRPPAHARRVLVGAVYALVGLIVFRLGLEQTLVPLGGSMADQLAHYGDTPIVDKAWYQHLWLVLFAGLIGFAATLIEPTLSIVADRAQDLSGGEFKARHFRWVVAAGVACGLALGTFRIIVGHPILWLILPIIGLLILLSLKTPKAIAPLALDAGPMATSVVVVPLVAAFGVAVAQVIPDRDPVLDGFGLVFFALLMPVVGIQLFMLFRRPRVSNKQ